MLQPRSQRSGGLGKFKIDNRVLKGRHQCDCLCYLTLNHAKNIEVRNTVNIKELKKIISRGEDSQHQFKEDFRNGDSLAAEMVAFSNSRGGSIFIGVSNKGDLIGLSSKDVDRINQLISH